MTRYELLDRIGVGGMAEIFRGKAVAAGGFEKPVAIKRILPHLSQDPRFVELLIAEAKVLSLLKHRNIVQIFDVGLGDDGQYFLVMEFVDGKDIGAVQRALEQKRRRLPFDLVLHIGAEICEALEHAHTSRGPDGKPMALVHRDVSPSNVLLSRAGEVKLTDFGIAKRAEQDATHGGAVRGKFAYISPEQARNEPLDPRSDVFSVGILIWELICNRRLFSHLDDLAALRAVREAQVQRPTEIDGRLPAEIDQILLTALARDKQRRYATSGQLGQKLRSLRYGLDVTVGDPATELARIIESTEEVERQSQQQMAPSRPSGRFDDPSEATVIRIRTADAFSARDNEGISISQARQVIDRFEEEETRQAQLSGEQLRLLRAAGRDSSSDVSKPRVPPLDTRERTRTRRDSEELTRTREPLEVGEDPLDTPTDETRMMARRDARAPSPGVRSPSVSQSHSASRSMRPPTTPQPATPTHPRVPTSASQLVPGTPAPAIMQQAVLPAPGLPSPRPQPTPSVHPHMQQPPLMPPGQAPLPVPAQAPVQAPLLPPLMQQAPFLPSPAGGWGPPIAAQRPMRDGTPPVRESRDQQPPYQSRASAASLAKRQQHGGLKPWMLVVGALLMAAVAFAITRLFLH